MEIKNISLHELRKMNDSEGLVIQGCGGDLKEWLDGINEMLTERGKLQNRSRFEKAYTFNNEKLTCLLLPFDGVKLDIGKLAMWRLETRENFGSTWLSDYVPNNLGGFIEEQSENHEMEGKMQENKRPKCPIIGADGNIFNIMGAASKTLKRSGMSEDAREMCSRVTSSGSYEEALGIIMEYVEPCSEAEMCEDLNMDIGL